MTGASSPSVAVSAALVVFGATGDLAHRKLYPALASLAARGQLPRRLTIVGVARTLMSDDDFANEVRNADRQGEQRRRPKGDRTFSTSGVCDTATSPARSTTTTRSGGSVNVLDDATRSSGPRGNVLYYLATIPQLFANVAAGARTRPGWHEEPAGRSAGSSSRSRSATTCESARELDDELHRALPRAPDLPDRPLPRQGDGPEHPRPAVHEHDLRAPLEPPVRRPRADHRGRAARRRAPRHVLRAVGSVARHRPEPPAPGARARRRWNRRRRSTPTPSATRR